MRRSAAKILGVVVAVVMAAMFLSAVTTSMSEAKTLKSFSQLTAGKQTLSISASQRSTALRAKGSLNFNCNGSYCACTGDADCNDMFTTNVCGPSAICIGSSCFCSRH